MSSDRDTSVRKHVMVKDAAPRYTDRYSVAYRQMQMVPHKREFDAILCSHCVYLVGPNGDGGGRVCSYSDKNYKCRLCTPFECIPKGFFKQRGYRPLDTEKIQQMVEEYVDMLLEGVDYDKIDS